MKGFYIVEALPVTAGQIRGVEPYNYNEIQIVDIVQANSKEDAIDLVQDDLKNFGYEVWDSETMICCHDDGSINCGWMHFTARKEN